MSAELRQAVQLIAGGDHAGAMRLVEVVLQRAPGDVTALNMLAGLKRHIGAHDEALALLDDAVRRAPNAAPLHFNRGNQLLAMARAEAAAAAYDRAIALRPDHQETRVNRARALAMIGVEHFEAGAFSRALEFFDAALRDHHLDPDAAYNRARALQALDRLDEALRAYNRAEDVHVDGDVLHNRAVLLQWLGRRDEAMRDFDAALAFRPDHAPTLYSKGIAHLAFGEYAQGWPLHELRHSVGVAPAMRDHTRDEPVWDGKALDGVLRIWPEQGIGDEVLFARLAARAQRAAGRAVLECAPRLAPLFARSFPTMDVRAFDAAAGLAAAQVAAGSVGATLGVEASDLDGAPYLVADAERVAVLRARYETLAAGRRIIGIAWMSKNPTLGAHKSARLDDWAALLTRDALFVNLQYGDTAAEVAAARARFGRNLHRDAQIDQLADLDAFAAQIAAMDEIVSVSNTTVHLAGALGVRCTVLVPPAQGLLWYWGVSGETTPWYRSVRIVRRASGETWAQHVEKAAALL